MNKSDIEYLQKTAFVDGELKLIFIEKCFASAPDSETPVYKFQMTDINSNVEMGEINFRAGFTENIEKYRGNIGFTVFESHRGYHLSARSCLLLKPFIRLLDMKVVWLTCNTDNIASKRNIELIGAKYIETRQMEENSPYVEFYPPNARVKLRYKWDIAA